MFISFSDNYGNYCYNTDKIETIYRYKEDSKLYIRFCGKSLATSFYFNSPDECFDTYKEIEKILRGKCDG